MTNKPARYNDQVDWHAIAYDTGFVDRVWKVIRHFGIREYPCRHSPKYHLQYMGMTCYVDDWWYGNVCTVKYEGSEVFWDSSLHDIRYEKTDPEYRQARLEHLHVCERGWWRAYIEDLYRQIPEETT